MAKELPYFKFIPSDWQNGSIQMCTDKEKVIFIELCCLYWQRLGDVPFNLAKNKFDATALNSLCDAKIFAVNDGDIYIEFLEEQLQEFNNVSETNRQNALLGWEKRRNKANAKGSQSERNAIRGEEKRRDKKKIDIPSIDDFLAYAKEKKPNIHEESVRLKYESWIESGWKSGKKLTPIKNWKTTLLNTLPYLKEEVQKQVYKQPKLYN